MNDPHEITVRVQTLEGVWETLGADRFRGVVPEGVHLTWNEWGPDTCSFVLRRNVNTLHPDLTTWTPIEVEVAGAITWDGRLKETPMAEGDDPTISVQAEGWQYALDDDVYAWNYVTTRLGGFQDMRSFATAALATHTVNWQTQTGDGNVLISLPTGTTVVTATGGCVVLDLGPGCNAITTSIDIATSFNTASAQLYVMGTDIPDWTGTSITGGSGRIDYKAGIALNDAVFTAANTMVTLSTTSITSPRRYIIILLYWGGGGGVTASETWIKIGGMRMSSSAGYLTSGVSNLKADTIIKHALLSSASQISTDVSNIAAGTFTIPEFALEGQHSAREVLSGVNAYENYELKMLTGRRLHFKPRPSAATLEIGEWSGADFQDASANSGDEIFNRVMVQGTGPDGQQLTVERFSEETAARVPANEHNPNGSFDTNTTGWAASASTTITRDTSTFHTTPACGRWERAGNLVAGDTLTYTFAGEVLAGVTYTVELWWRAVVSAGTRFIVRLGAPTAAMPNYTDNGQIDVTVTAPSWGGFGINPLAIKWVPRAKYPVGQFQMIVIAPTSSGAFYIDSVNLFRTPRFTLASRRGFLRTKILPVASALTIATATRIGDLYLTAHRTVPYKGGFQAVGTQGVRTAIGGAGVHPAHIPVGAIVRCAHRADPDTGGWGRDGKIAAVSYDHDALSSTVTLDENRAGFEALLSRLAVVQGQRRT